MGYTTIHYFEDLQDFNHPYKVGDIFPRLGLNVSEERLKELSGNNNLQKKPLIRKNEVKYKKAEINRMTVSELKELAKKHCIENAKAMTGTELRKFFIDKMT